MLVISILSHIFKFKLRSLSIPMIFSVFTWRFQALEISHISVDP